jgi:hypothetical protein
MTTPQELATQWKVQNAERLMDCRWGLKITPEACRLYQSRSARKVLHFNGDRNPYPRVNADYLQCCLPEECPHLISDAEAEALGELHRATAYQRNPGLTRAQNQARQWDRMVSPASMLGEKEWHRSLVKA